MLNKIPKRVIRILVVASLAAAIFAYVLIPVRLGGADFNPIHKYLGISFINRMSYVVSSPQVGDLVAIRASGMSVIYVRRILATPGSNLMILSGTVFVNQAPLRDPDFKGTLPHQMSEQILKEDEYFVVGSKPVINGERQFGRVQRDRIIGQLLF